MANPDSAVALESVGKAFPASGSSESTVLALENVSLEIRSGEFFCLLGPSGCGKTTLLNMIAGFEPPTAGSIHVFGKRVQEPGADRGVIFQSDSALLEWLTVEQNVAFGPRMRHQPHETRDAAVETNIRLVGLAEHRHKVPRELSGGMKQRVQIARVLANDPRVLLMDEPFAALDAHTRGRMQREVQRIWAATRKTVVFVTHDITEALWLGDNVAVMTRGPASTIKAIVPVPLPRPRAKMTPAFVDLFNQLEELIESQLDEEPTEQGVSVG